VKLIDNKEKFLAFKNKAIEFIGLGLITILLLTIPLSIFKGAIEWLQFGIWNSLTPCKSLGVLCSNNTGGVGINIILDWLGSHDISFLAIVCVVCVVFICMQLSD
jgi:hypothetical protein